MVIEIPHRWQTTPVWTGEAESLKDAVERAAASGASLDGASLDRARLVGASLDGASLDRARLVGASLDGASLVGARLDGARLDGASLDGARLDGASLDRAHLTPIRDDLWAVLCSAPRETEGLRKALIEGRIDGSCYSGKCACLVGTLARLKGHDIYQFAALRPNSDRPAERWFLALKPGDTPETSQVARITLGWIDQWLETMRAAFGPTVSAPEASR